jgi:hypothetical protein
MSSSLPTLALLDHDPDPSKLGWPASLPLELALKQRPVSDTCAAYGVSRETYLTLRDYPPFQDAVARALEALKEEGMSFKVKARAQSEALLTTSWGLIHAPEDKVPPSVRADLIKFTIRAAGLDGSLDQRANANAAAMASANNALQINIHFSGEKREQGVVIDGR